jgi:hypothetical protein
VIDDAAQAALSALEKLRGTDTPIRLTKINVADLPIACLWPLADISLALTSANNE